MTVPRLSAIGEYLPIVLFEASAQELPSLARDTGGGGGAVTEGENGYLVPEAKAKQYAERIP